MDEHIGSVQHIASDDVKREVERGKLNCKTWLKKDKKMEIEIIVGQ